VTDACELEELTQASIASFIQPPGLAVEALAKVTLNEDELRRMGNGLRVTNRFDLRESEIAAFDETGSLRAIVRTDGDELRPAKCFSQSANPD